MLAAEMLRLPPLNKLAKFSAYCWREGGITIRGSDVSSQLRSLGARVDQGRPSQNGRLHAPSSLAAAVSTLTSLGPIPLVNGI
jgi:hypothetical protein